MEATSMIIDVFADAVGDPELLHTFQFQHREKYAKLVTVEDDDG